MDSAPSTAAPATPRLAVDWLGTVPYRDALELQERAVAARRAGAAGDRLLLLEHPPVITLGRGADESNVLTPAGALAARGVDVVRVSRGGDVTLHAPGQLVGYLVVDLEARGAPDVHRFLRGIESALIAALGELGLEAGCVPGWTGVFVAGAEPPRKLASIGIGVRGWVSWHGFALNAILDPMAFADIVPCGLHGIRMTSLARELGREPSAALFDTAREAVAAAFGRWLG